MKKTKKPPRVAASYKWTDEDRALIAALKAHYTRDGGPACTDTAILRTALRALATREGVVNKMVNKK